MIRKPHLSLIAGHSVRHGIRGGAGLVAMLLTLVIGLVMASVVISPLEEVDRVAREAAPGVEASEVSAELSVEVTKVTRKAIDWAVEPSAAQLDFLTQDRPAAVSAILVLLFLVTPLLSCLAGFNQTSGDIGSKGLRFLLFRTERSNIFLGRFLGTLAFSALTYLALFVIVMLYMAVKVKVHSPGDMLLWLGEGYLRLLVFSMPYIALCAWVSASIDSPFGALVIALLIAYLFPLFVGIADNSIPAAAYAQYATPWGWKWWMLAPLGGQLLGGLAAMLGFTALLTWLGLRHFSTRDL